VRVDEQRCDMRPVSSEEGIISSPDTPPNGQGTNCTGIV
jgi:hypothetical protein